MTTAPDPAAASPDDRSSLGLALLSFSAGSMDAIAFLALGGVFTSAMSGNTIVLGVALGQGDMTEALYAVTALFGYLAGVAAATVSLNRLARGSGWTLGIQAAILGAFASIWSGLGGSTEGGWFVIHGLIAMSAVAMGLQGGIGRAIGAPGIMTVIFTSTYTAIVSSLVERWLARDRPRMSPATARQLGSLAAYLGGAVIAAVVILHARAYAPWLPFVAILSVFTGLKLGRLHLGNI